MSRSLIWLGPILSVGLQGAAQEPAPAAADRAAEIARKLQNPVASLISVPLQNNVDFGYGPDEALRYQLNVQPVIPFSLNEDWNLITRTIVPIIHQEAQFPGDEHVNGIGDALQSFFLSPKEPIAGWILAAGPVLGWATASDDRLGSEKWTLGPTVLALKQESGWTYGILANHVWSFAGDDSRDDVSATFLQPFLSFTTKKQTTFGLNTESLYDWEHEEWIVPLNLSVTQLVRFGKQPVSFSFGPRYYADKPQGGPEWGLRFVVTLVFPK